MGAVGAFLVDLAAGLAAGVSAAAPWFVYSTQIVPRLEAANARRAAYPVAALPAVGTTIATIARLRGVTTGSVEVDITLIAAFIGLACSWAPIVRFALAVTGGHRDVGAYGSRDRNLMARSAATVMATLILFQTVVAFAGASFASMLTCFDAEAMLADAGAGPPNPAPLADALPHTPPEAGALFLGDLPMNIDQAADSRHDPDTREQLVAARFSGGYGRYWYAIDGHDIHADVMEFGSPEEAAAYQGQVTRHACQYANVAFEAPMGGVGLQVRYGTGDPIVEQIGWVAGNRRYVVSVSEIEPPTDHRRILAIQEAATARWPVGGPASDAGRSPAPSAEPTPRIITDPAVIEGALADVRTAVEATLSESTVWINRHIAFSGSSVIPDGATAFAGGQMSLEEPRKMRAMVQYAEIEDTEANSAEIIFDGSMALLRGRAFDLLAGDGRWLLVDLTSSDPHVAPVIALASGINDPSMVLLTLYGATHVLENADEVAYGDLPVRRYTLNIQLDAALDEVPDQFEAAYLDDLRAMGEAQVEPQYTAEVWVDEAGVIRHIEYTQALGPKMGEGSMSTTADFSDFGLPLELDYPPPEHITPIEDAKAPIEHLPRA